MGIFSRRRTTRVETWEEAEALAAKYMRKRLGFGDAQVTAPGADWGVDVISKKAVAQVKFQATKTGSPEVQRLAGVAAGKRVKRLFFSVSGYTPRAVAAAEASSVALFTYDLQGKVTALNTPARKMSGRASTGFPTRDSPSPKEGGSSIWADFVETYKSIDKTDDDDADLDKVSATGWGCTAVFLMMCGIAGISVGVAEATSGGFPADRIERVILYFLIVVALLVAGLLSVRQAWRAYERSRRK